MFFRIKDLWGAGHLNHSLITFNFNILIFSLFRLNDTRPCYFSYLILHDTKSMSNWQIVNFGRHAQEDWSSIVQCRTDVAETEVWTKTSLASHIWHQANAFTALKNKDCLGSLTKARTNNKVNCCLSSSATIHHDESALNKIIVFL